MNTLEAQILTWLAGRLTPHRLRHSIGAGQCAADLAGTHGVAAEPLRLAGLLHDCARELEPRQALELAAAMSVEIRDVDREFPVLMHGRLAEAIAKREFAIEDGAVLSAVRYHTAGNLLMSLSDKIFFLADHVEPNRDQPLVESVRLLAANDIDAAMLRVLDLNIAYLEATGKMVDPDTWPLRESLAR